MNEIYQNISFDKQNFYDLKNKVMNILDLMNDNPSEEELFLKNIQKNQ